MVLLATESAARMKDFRETCRSNRNGTVVPSLVVCGAKSATNENPKTPVTEIKMTRGRFVVCRKFFNALDLTLNNFSVRRRKPYNFAINRCICKCTAIRNANSRRSGSESNFRHLCRSSVLGPRRSSFDGRNKSRRRGKRKGTHVQKSILYVLYLVLWRGHCTVLYSTHSTS